MTTPTSGDENYDIIKIIAKKGKNISIAKVRSKVDKKIYCMRKIKNEDYKLNININELKQTLIEINHPHIIKYYDVFTDNKYIYIIMEYIDTDIKNYIERYHITNSLIPEENIWFILLQCLSALEYIHTKNLAETFGIRLSNIFMPTDRGIKLGIIKNTIEKRKWEDDIKLLYKFFEIIMCPKRFKHGQGIMAYLSDPVNNNYDIKLREIIKEMDTNPKEANKIFKTTEDYYIDKYGIKEKNNNIKSVFDSLSKHKKLKEILNKEENTKNKNNYLMNICNAVFEEDENYYRSIEKFRRLLSLENKEINFNPVENNIEDIEPNLILDYILKSKEPLIINENNEKKKIFISDLFVNNTLKAIQQ